MSKRRRGTQAGTPYKPMRQPSPYESVMWWRRPSLVRVAIYLLVIGSSTVVVTVFK